MIITKSLKGLGDDDTSVVIPPACSTSPPDSSLVLPPTSGQARRHPTGLLYFAAQFQPGTSPLQPGPALHRQPPGRVIRASTEKTINGEDAGGGGKTPKLAQDTAMHKHLQKAVDPRKLASSKSPGPARRRAHPARGASSQPSSKLGVAPLTLEPTSSTQPEARVTRASSELLPAGRAKRVAKVLGR